jgi:sulfite exporter TauE/SafE
MDGVLIDAFSTGLLGSAHCVAMCGGIVGALSGGVDPRLRRRPTTQLGYGLAYNIGRLCSYAAIGALFGALASGLEAAIVEAQLVLRAVAGVLMAGLGLHLFGLFPRFVALERAGAPLFARISPLAKRLLPIRSHSHAALLGAMWGWVPCGMVYTALALATASGGPMRASLAMLAFGAGTLPAMLAGGLVSGHVLARLGSAWVRRAAGVAITVFGVMSIVYSGTALASQHGRLRADAVCAGAH